MWRKYSKYLLWLVYVYFSYLLLLITLQYIPYHTDVAFLRIKQEVIVFDHYKIAFFTHVYTSIFLMIFGAIQFSNYIQKKYVKLHRISGRFYVGILLLLSGPSGLVMSYYANGGVLAQVSFLLLSTFWMLFTFMSFYFVLKRQLIKHQKFAIRSFALTLSAISLRLFKYLLVLFFEPYPMDAYRIAAWSGWTFNLLLAEIIIYYKFSRISK
ncbi:DUF2306 domain-containing protein [Flavobacterium cyclinae]|uniref:DUF2306 domain-containing protein n=1 Tax=Flavobacterium cyclinae TaxID=2895947 RepID=UPI001E351551|nr:DUF2306 domain-containing protein [Flavobacterium cyclinae]UGS20366.1 DUF2306 domain-containing protein [Flavobacterium cyclinae]